MAMRYFVGDFETTVYEGQSETEVWASAIVELNTEQVLVFTSIEDTFYFLSDMHESIVVYYHNLKYDGHFWLDYILRCTDLELAIDGDDFTWTSPYKMANKTYQYNISGMGQWYNIKIKINNHTIEFRDSYKLLPFSVKAIGKAFNTKHRKLEIEYKGFRKAHGTITQEESDYIKNDVLVVKEALEVMFSEGHNRLTIGSCCLNEYKTMVQFPEKGDVYGAYAWNELYPNLANRELDRSVFGYDNVDSYIRKSYKGGWCYLAKGKESKVFKNGITLDVNSLYPSVMSSESGSKYPVGPPEVHGSGEHRMQVENGYPVVSESDFYFVRFSCAFDLKTGMLPTVQIKGSKFYKGTDWLETSRILCKDGLYYDSVEDVSGKVYSSTVTMTMTETDYRLFREHYNVRNLEILDYIVFPAMVGIFDRYIEKYRKIKVESTGAKRTLAKLFLNNLYGKMATNPRSDCKVARLDENGVIKFDTVSLVDKDPVYIPVGSAITSYARNFTIHAAQENYYGPNNEGFIYADTDSIHCDLSLSEVSGVEIDDVNFCKWKCESQWDTGIFVRQKTYIEVTNGEYDIKCAGMPESCKAQIREKMENGILDLTNFTSGLKVEGKLVPKRIKGGIILVPTTYELK